MYNFPTPHLEKLNATLANEKLPLADHSRIKDAIKYYEQWIQNLELTIKTTDQIIPKMVKLLNDYKLYIDINLIFDSEEDFLYRQKGQLKLDNSIIEEFLPRLVVPSIIPELKNMNIYVGPSSSFSSIYFSSSLDSPQVGGGLSIRTKDQDFSISKPLYIKASHSQNFDPIDSVTKLTYITYVAAECKTNLDKTMFQEACATAHDTKSAVSGAKYYLLCEWLDMTPLSTAPTDIDEIIILRKAKRLNSNIRKEFNTGSKRKTKRTQYLEFLQNNPFRAELFERFINHIRRLLINEMPTETNILDLGYF